MLSLTRDGRVVSSGFSMKSEDVTGSGTDSSRGKGFYVPSGIIIRNQKSGEEYGPGMFVRPNKETFEEFQKFLGSDSEAASNWSIDTVGPQELFGSKRKLATGDGKPATSILGDATFKNFRANLKQNVLQVIAEYKKMGIDIIKTPEFLKITNEYLLDNYRAQLEEGFAKRENGEIIRDANGQVEYNFVTGENGENLIQHVSGQTFDARIIETLPAAVEFAIEAVIQASVEKDERDEFAKRVFNNTLGVSRRTIFESKADVTTRFRGKSEDTPATLQVKTPAQAAIDSIVYQLNLIDNLERSVPVHVENENERNPILQSLARMRDEILAAMPKNSESVTDDEAERLNALSDKNINELTRVVRDIVNQEGSLYSKSSKKLVYSLDSAKVAARLSTLTALLSEIPEESSDIERLERELVTLQRLDIGMVLTSFIESIGERSGSSPDEIKNFLLREFGPNAKKYFDENLGIGTSFSLGKVSDVLEALSSKLGLTTHSYSTLFSPKSVLEMSLKDASLRERVGLQEGLITEGSIHRLATARNIVGIVGNLVNPFIEEHKIKQILGEANPDKRKEKVKELLETLKKVEGENKPLANYVIKRIEDLLVNEDGDVKRVGEQKQRTTEDNELYRQVENMGAALLLTSSEINLKEASHHFKLEALKILPYFMEYSNPHALVMNYASLLGVHERNGSLVIDDDTRRRVEEAMGEEDAKRYEEIKGESKQIAFLVDFYSRNGEGIEMPLSLFALARMKATRGTLWSEGILQYSDTQLNLRLPEGIEGIKTFIEDFKKKRADLDSFCATTAYLLIKDSEEDFEQQREVAKDYLYRNMRNFSGTNAQDGYYTEFFVNLHIASSLGKITGYEHSDDPRKPCILRVEGSSGEIYEILTHATDRAGYGDVHVVSYDSSGKATVWAVEQKTRKKGIQVVTPHVGDVSGTSDIIDYLHRATGKKTVQFGHTATVYITLDESGTTMYDDKTEASLDPSKNKVVQGNAVTAKYIGGQ